MEFNPLTQIIVDFLDNFDGAFFLQRGSEEILEGLLLLVGRLRCWGIEYGGQETSVDICRIAGIEQGVVDIGRSVVEGREQETQLRHSGKIGNATIVKFLLLWDIVQGGLGLLDRADGTQQVLVGFVGILCVAVAIFVFEGNIVCIAANEDQVGGTRLKA